MEKIELLIFFIKDNFITLTIFIALIGFILYLLAPLFASSSLYRPRGHLLTKTETRSYKSIKPLVVSLGLDLMCQVRIADVLSVKGNGKSKRWWNAFKKISSKHVDFVVVNPSNFKIICAIEIDDRSHNKKKVKERDAFVNRAFKTAGVPLLRCAPGQENIVKKGIEHCLIS